ncbi:hypothetical protein NHH03_25970 [Stieleria sp. TO1_6]|uniref:hypothetical protein n=1 Tax=Stieleria tagensis TaxID=2956795 RepID=UPI00209AC107|nr:hypothetical protein [Stieleria tagensis]MCO8125211.1 hypothetical protein [Stieleria tagensis]
MNAVTDSQQRYFGVAIATALLMLSWIMWRAVGSPWLTGGLVIVACIVALVYYLLPGSQPTLISVFQAITFPIRWTATVLVLAVVYFVVLTPISVWFRFSGKSIRHNDQDAKTNWQSIDLPSDPTSYFRTF